MLPLWIVIICILVVLVLVLSVCDVVYSYVTHRRGASNGTSVLGTYTRLTTPFHMWVGRVEIPTPQETAQLVLVVP
jgi:hypothetical protein